MFCPKCGQKRGKNSKFCIKCGAKIKKQATLFRFATLLFTLTTFAVLSYFVVRKNLSELAANFSTLSIIKQKAKLDYTYLANAENKYLKEAKYKAHEWDKDSGLYQFKTSVDNIDKDDNSVIPINPAITYTFYSEKKDKALVLNWFSTGSFKQEEKGFLYKDQDRKVDPYFFPPIISVKKASELASKMFMEKTGKDPTGISATLYSGREYWYIIIYARSDEADKVKSHKIYRVYFDEKVEPR